MIQLIFIFFLLIIGNPSQALVKVRWGKELKNAAITFMSEGKKPLIYLRVDVPGKVKSSTFIWQEEEIDVKVIYRKNRSFLFVPGSEGTLLVAMENGSTQNRPFKMLNAQGTTKIHKSCLVPEITIKQKKTIKNRHVAGIYCKLDKKNQNLKMFFSTAQNSEWLGSNLFEIDGKGTRWKVFQIPLLNNKTLMEFRWGLARQEQLVKVKINELQPQTDDQKLFFYVGQEFSQFSSQLAETSTDFSSTALAVNGLYILSPGLRISAEGSYQILSFGDEEENPKYFNLLLGIEYDVFNNIFVDAGYNILSYTNSNLLLLTEYEAPYVGLGINTRFFNRDWTFKANYSQPLSGAENSSQIYASLEAKPLAFFESTKIGLFYRSLSLKDQIELESTVTTA